MISAVRKQAFGLFVVLSLSSGGAHAQPVASASPPGKIQPTFTFAERRRMARPWIGTGNLGLLVMSGNSNLLTLTSSAFVAWNDAKNRVALDASLAYSRQDSLVAVDADADGRIRASEIRTSSVASAQTWHIKPRYDRFLTDADSVYVAGGVASDRLAGKKLTSGGQVGYGRKLYVDEVHDINVEAGYDFTHEGYETPADAFLDVHSARLFAGYQLTLAQDILVQTSIEGLSNVSPEATPTGEVDALDDTRVNWRTLLSAKVWRNISARFSFLMRYDNWPAPRPAFALPFVDGLVIPADKLDTQTEFAVVVNFL